MTATIIGVASAALIGGATGAVATHIVQKKIREKEYADLMNRLYENNIYSRGVISRYNRIS